MWPGESEGVICAVSQSQEAEVAAQELARQLLYPNLGFVLFFCSAEYDLEALGAALEQNFGGIELVGCTSAGEISAHGYGRGGITALGFDSRSFSVSCAQVQHMEHFSLTDAQQLVDQLISQCRRNELAPITGHSFALTLFDGLSSREEVVLGALSTALGSIPHFGGSAGDDNHLSHTHVFHSGRFHTHSAVLVLFNTWLNFEVFTTHHIEPLQEKLVVTRADSQTRRVYELNAAPAAQEYAELIGVPLHELNQQVFAAHPLAVRIREKYYVRAIQQVHEDLSLSFYCAVDNGIVLTAMQPGPLLPNLESLFDGLQQRLGPLLVTIGCDCVLRRLEVEAGDHSEQVSGFLRNKRVMGFNTYGEQFNGMHINQSFTGVAIGRPGGGR